jgi:hypothetical protein
MSTKEDAPQRFHTAIEYRTFTAALAKTFTQVKPSQGKPSNLSQYRHRRLKRWYSWLAVMLVVAYYTMSIQS